MASLDTNDHLGPQHAGSGFASRPSIGVDNVETATFESLLYASLVLEKPRVADFATLDVKTLASSAGR